MTRAALWYENTLPAKNGIVVLCPGMNGSGKRLVSEKPWIDFARENDLGLVALSFSSPVEKLYAKPSRGYYYAEQGAGKILLQGISEIYGTEESRRTNRGSINPSQTGEPKLLLFGFSGGALFISHFVRWQPKRVLVWSAYSASFWPSLGDEGNGPPGIVACGEFDGVRYGPTFAYFQQGRQKDASWIWVSLKNTGHMRNQGLERFTRNFFDIVLTGNIRTPVYFDAELMTPVKENDLLLQPALTVWLPNSELAKAWQQIHHP
jgi:hypothetical protein